MVVKCPRCEFEPEIESQNVAWDCETDDCPLIAVVNAYRRPLVDPYVPGMTREQFAAAQAALEA